MAHVVVFVPGIMGSVLKFGDEVIWPGSLASLKLPYRKMRELLDPNLVATDCIRSFVLPQYQYLFAELEACGFQEADGTLVPAPYDWRKAIETTTEALAQKLAAVVQRHGANVEISLVAHSMGGLLSRYFLESGKFKNHPAFFCVRRLATLATPHRGATVALPLCLGLEKRLFLNPEQVLQLASHPDYAGPYELLPRPAEPIAWDGTGNNELPVLDIYDPAVAGRLRLHPGHLEAARKFHAALEAGVRPPHVRYFCFSGNREETAAYVRLQARSGDRLAPVKIDQQDAGDGTVPNWSSTLPGVQFLYVAGEHGTIYKTRDLLRTLGAFLGRPGVLAAGVVTEIFLRETVVTPSALIHATLKLGVNTTIVRGQLVLERLEVDPTGEIVKAHAHASHAIQYEGPEIETFALVFTAPELHGHYRISYLPNQASHSSSEAELIVQISGS